MSKSESSHWLVSLDPLLRQSLEQSIVNKEEGIIIQNTIVEVGYNNNLLTETIVVQCQLLLNVIVSISLKLTHTH